MKVKVNFKQFGEKSNVIEGSIGSGEKEQVFEFVYNVDSENKVTIRNHSLFDNAIKSLSIIEEVEVDYSEIEEVALNAEVLKREQEIEKALQKTEKDYIAHKNIVETYFKDIDDVKITDTYNDWLINIKNQIKEGKIKYISDIRYSTSRVMGIKTETIKLNSLNASGYRYYKTYDVATEITYKVKYNVSEDRTWSRYSLSLAN